MGSARVSSSATPAALRMTEILRAHLYGMVLKASYDFGWCPHTVGNASRTSKTWCITESADSWDNS